MDQNKHSVPQQGTDLLEKLVKQANAGDKIALQRLQVILDTQPEIWQTVGDLAKHAELALLRLIAGEDKLLLEASKRTVDVLRRDISPPNPSPLERLLVDRVVMTWMRVQYLDTTYASLHDLCIQEKKFAVHQKESAQRLFDASVKSLRTVQSKLGRLPAPSPSGAPQPPVKLRIVRQVG